MGIGERMTYENYRLIIDHQQEQYHAVIEKYQEKSNKDKQKKKDLNDDLLPCIKCGSKAKVHCSYKGRWKYVQCTNPECGNKIKGCNSYELAINVWNAMGVVE